MRCPFCKAKETKVIDKRLTENGTVNRRRRVCLKCKKRFTTYERVEGANIIVIKKDGRREPFNMEKIKIGIMKACEKRPITEEQIDKLVEEIVRRIMRYKTNEIKSKLIGELVIKKLKALDKVAYLRFASVYKSFDDIKSFEKELKELKR
ncbi:MAG: transcriptional repressor NrdR [Nanoarchaeota archaeon]|nr:transcriptional repressor NrdR [Nanoarchaeota archaeon]